MRVFGTEFITSQRVYLLVVPATLAVAFFTAASLFGRRSHLLEMCTHFRLQYALAATACACALAALHSWRLLPLALCCAVFNWAQVAPYYSAPARAASASSPVRLKLMLANVLGSNRDYDALAAAVAESRADVVVLQEFTEGWGANVGAALGERYPYSKLVPRPGGSGMALFSRHPLASAEVLQLDASTHPAVLARLDVEGTTVTVLSMHPPTPVRADKFTNRNEQFARAAAIMRATEGPKLLIGDLNTTMWSPFFKDLIESSGLRDARRGFGLRPSWPVPLPAPLQIPIDQCLVGEGMTVESVRTGRRTGSDHRPLLVDVSFEGAPASAGNLPR